MPTSTRRSSASPTQNRSFAAKGEGAKAEKGDRVTINFKGTINGTPFDGGTGENIQVVIGAGQFIPGFEDQLIGIGAGETRTLKVTFPKNYASENLAGQPAEFETTATSIEAPQKTEINDEFAKTLGLESLDKLKQAARDRLAAEYAGATRQRVKRTLLDRLDETHKFEAPPSLIEEEFNLMWNSVKAEMESSGKTFADENTTEEEAKEEYRAIADRRVRLGLVLSEIGEKNKITVTDDEVSRAVIERAPLDARPREGGLGLLPQQRQCAGPASCTDLRGQGGRLHSRACQRDREEGSKRRTLQGRRRKERGLIEARPD